MLQALNRDYANLWAFRVNSEEIIRGIKSVTTVAVLGAGIFSSAYLAHRNPTKWWPSAASITLVNLYLLPKILRFGNEKLIKIALMTSLAVQGCFMMGGIGGFFVSMIKFLWTMLKNNSLPLPELMTKTFYIAFLGTGFFGYGGSFFDWTLNNFYSLTMEPEKWKRRLTRLVDYCHNHPEIGRGLLQTNLWENIAFNLSLLNPIDTNHIISPGELPPNALPAQLFSDRPAGVDQFRQVLTTMQQDLHVAQFSGSLPSDSEKEHYLTKLKCFLSTMTDNDLRKSISLLLSDGLTLVPDMLSKDQFMSIFKEEAIEFTNDLIKAFLDSVESWGSLQDKYQKFDQDFTQFETKINGIDFSHLPIEEKTEYKETLTSFCKEFNELRSAVEKIFVNKRIWQDFTDLDDENLPFEQSSAILEALKDQNLIQEIDQTYRLLFKTGQGTTLSDRLQFMTNTLLVLQDEEEEPVSAIMYLAANKGFKQSDCEYLQGLLGLDSPHDLEEVMEKIGIGTEKDLYEKNILSKDEQISKNEILENLREYIKASDKVELTPRVKKQSDVTKDSILCRLINKINALIYRAIHYGLILTPMLIYPEMGALGLLVGACFFSLKRFGGPAIAQSLSLIFQFYSGILQRRRVFYHGDISSGTISRVDQFVNSNFFFRMKMLNDEFLFAMLFSIADLGGFLQGIIAIDEILN